MKKIFLCLAVFLLGTLSITGQTQQQPAPITAGLNAQLPFDSLVVTGTLNNGLRYYIRNNHKPEKRAELRLVVNAGSVLEDDNQRGLAHVLEHMAFSGTAHFKKQELLNYLESIGMRFGPDVNAYTSFDETVYMLELPTDTLQDLKQGFQILEDWAHLLSFDDSEIDREKKVVIEEWRLGRGADARLRDKQFPILFKDSRYAERLPIGEVKILESFDHDLVRKFYKDWYRPDLMAVIAVGDFDVEMVRQMIVSHFEKLTNPEKERAREFFPVPDHDQTLYAVATDSEATNSGLGIYYLHDTLPQWRHGDYRRQLIEALYNGMLNFRLGELSRQADPPFIYGYASSTRLVRTKAADILGTSVKDNGMIRGLKAILQEAGRARKFGFTKTELDRQKSEMLSGIENAYSERDKTESSSYASEYIRNFLNGEPSPGIPYEYRMYESYIPAVTLDEVNALSATFMPPKDRVIGEDGPAKAGVSIPNEAVLRPVLDSAAQMEVTRYIDTVSNTPLMTGPPNPGTIVEEHSRSDIGVTEWKLSNGIRVILKPTDFKNDEIVFNSFSPGGTSLAPDSIYIPAVTSTQVVDQGGLDGMNLVALEKKLAGKIASATPYIDELFQGISGNSSVKDMETMFQLIHLYLTEPRKDSSAYLSWKTRARGMLENRSSSPEAAFQDTIQATLGQHHLRRLPWNLQTLDRTNLQESYDFYKDRFADPGRLTFFFVGSFKLDSIKPMVLEYLGSLPSLHRNDNWRDIGVHLIHGVIEKTVKRGIDPKSQVNLYFTGPFEWSMRNRFAVSMVAEVLRIKLRESLRQDLGGTYGVGVGGGSWKDPKPVYNMMISFGCDPSRVDEMIKATFAVLDSVKQFGLPESYLEKVREIQRRERETGLKQNNFWLSSLEFYYEHNEDPIQIIQLDERLKWLTVDFIRDAARQYFDTTTYFKAVLMPEK